MKYIKLFEDKNVVYFGQCDSIRKKTGGEEFWQKMMTNKKILTEEEFKSKVPKESLDYVLDGDTIEEWCAGDSDSYLAASKVNGENIYFLHTHGYEFIWK